jgi:hypothetical protein
MDNVFSVGQQAPDVRAQLVSEIVNGGQKPFGKVWGSGRRLGGSDPMVLIRHEGVSKRSPGIDSNDVRHLSSFA